MAVPAVVSLYSEQMLLSRLEYQDGTLDDVRSYSRLMAQAVMAEETNVDEIVVEIEDDFFIFTQVSGQYMWT